MKGSEKQVKWAKDILEVSKPQIERELRALEGRKGESIDNARAEFQACLIAIENCDRWGVEASWIIEYGKDGGLDRQWFIHLLEREDQTSEGFYNLCFPE